MVCSTLLITKKRKLIVYCGSWKERLGCYATLSGILVSLPCKRLNGLHLLQAVTGGEDKSKNVIMSFLKYLKYVFIDLTIIDNLSAKKRFTLSYNLIQMSERKRVFLYEKQYDGALTETIGSLFEGALAVEREAHDMFGVVFKKNGDLRRILTDYGFKGNPLRKDFPLSGYQEVKYSIIKKALKIKFLQLAQEFRVFDYILPWLSIKEGQNNERNNK